MASYSETFSKVLNGSPRVKDLSFTQAIQKRHPAAVLAPTFRPLFSIRLANTACRSFYFC